MILPALKQGAGANQLSEYPEGEEPQVNENLNVEELSSEDRKNAQTLIDMYGEETVQKLFSKTW